MISLPISYDVHKDAEAKAKFLQELHVNVKANIEKKVEHYAMSTNNVKRRMFLNPVIRFVFTLERKCFLPK